MTLPSVSRREFLKASAATGGGLLLGFHLAGQGPALAATSDTAVNAFVRIGSDDSVTIINARSEMGQDVYTAMTMLVAEELEVDLARVRVEFAPPAEAYINALLGGQLTGGSTSTRDGWEKLRRAGATARQMLIAAAADMWGVGAESCRAENGTVVDAQGRRATYGELASRASALPIPANVPLKAAKDWKVIGSKTQRRLDTPLKVQGMPIFAIDASLPDMQVACVILPPSLGARMKSFDDSRARSVPGVSKIVPFTRGVAVVAASYWQARKARDLLEVQWDEQAGAMLDMRGVWAGLAQASQQPGAVFRQLGDVDSAMEQARRVVKATYQLPFLSHTPMEPMSVVADVRKDAATIVTGTQFQQLIPHVVAGLANLKPEQVRLVNTFLGGGFGRRGEMDYILDAAEISMAAGVPVKYFWTREDDMTHDSYRPAGLYQVECAVDGAGRPTALTYRITGPSISARLFPSIVKDGIDPFAVEGIDNFPYAVPALRFSYQIHDTGVPPGYWRAVSHNQNCFVVEGFIDELAHAAGKDPIEYRLGLIDYGTGKHEWSGLSAGQPVGRRMQRALQAVRDRSGWSTAIAKSRGRGVALMEGYNTVVALVAEVTVSPRHDVSVDRITTVIDCGSVVHPDQVRAQVEGSIVFGQSACLFGEITVNRGVIQQNNFDTYRLVRMNEAPKTIDIHVLDNQGAAPGGVGEPVTAVVQAAIGNAIFAATGIRVRRMPFSPENIAAAAA